MEYQYNTMKGIACRRVFVSVLTTCILVFVHGTTSHEPYGNCYIALLLINNQNTLLIV